LTNNKTISILGYNVFTGSKEFFADGATGVIDTLNPHSYVLARKDRQFREALKAADWLIPDGVGIKYAARVLERRTLEKIAGSDLHEVIISSLDKRGGSCFYLGSTEETLAKIRERMAREHPAVRVATYSPPFSDAFSRVENNNMISAVNSFSPDVLFVGMTAPRQEKWVFENREKLEVPLVCSIGAVLDFYAGTVQRSGQLWIRLGLEWLPRLLREPQRLWRRNFISTPLFLWYVFLEKTKDKKQKKKSV
jgi:N-acetylglucosaminyldiphosphoundecaprenol N-acetyl-beta-D-mannosaminyltransferase